jgi:hypothetical protein
MNTANQVSNVYPIDSVNSVFSAQIVARGPNTISAIASIAINMYNIILVSPVVLYDLFIVSIFYYDRL